MTDGSTPTCIFILSTKSAGSSILQRMVKEELGASTARTRHFEGETLYWTKAASALGLEQIRLPRSEVPIPADRSRREIQDFLRENGVAPIEGAFTRKALFAKFAELCRAKGPVLLEKSPHHLYEAAATALIEEFMRADTGVTVKVIGLVRNPMDAIYSSWRRFGVFPWVEEKFWRIAYANLLELKQRCPEHVTIMRYEDLVGGKLDFANAVSELGLRPTAQPRAAKFHSKSLSKWRRDASFGHALAEETEQLALKFGYEPADMAATNRHWPMRNHLRHWAYLAYHHTPEGLRKRAVAQYRRFFKDSRSTTQPG